MSERLDAYHLQFPKGQPATFVRYPVDRAESEVSSGTGSGQEAIPGPRPVLAEQRKVCDADVPHSGRVFRVIFCSECSWEYGAWWPRAGVYGYWGDCPSCGRVTRVGSAYRVRTSGASGSASGARATRPAQQELGF